MREGSYIEGPTQPPHRGTSPQLKAVDKVNGMAFQDYTKAVRFENLTSIDPIEKFKLETTPDLIETRVIDLVTPIGKGTRGIDRRAAAHGQNHHSQTDLQRHHHEPSGSSCDGAAH